MVPRPEAILFDFDYTLADSSAGIITCCNHALRCLSRPPVAAEQVRATIGLPLEEMFLLLTGCRDAAQGDLFRRYYLTLADRVMLDATQVLPGVAELVAELSGRGLLLAVVTTKYSCRVEAVLERDRLHRCFRSVIGSEKVSRPKPDPEPVYLALRTLGIRPSQALMVGDSPVDAAAAAAAGVTFVAVTTGTTPATDPAFSAAAAHLPSVLHLTAWLGLEEG